MRLRIKPRRATSLRMFLPRNNSMRRYIFALLLCCFAGTGALARDVDLDGIYVKKSSKFLSRLVGAKLDLYAAVGAVPVADGVAFAGWSSGARLVYVREQSDRISLMEYYTSSRRFGQVASLSGGVTYARMPVNGRYAYMTLLDQGKGIVPESFFVTVDLRSGNVKKYPSRSVFVDYGVTRYGESFIREEGDGLVETFPDMMKKRTVLSRSQYAAYVKKNRAVIAVPSTDFRRVLVLSGEGGSYDAAVFEDGRMTGRIDGVGSCVDLCWIDNKSIAFRHGAPGLYGVRLYSCVDGTTSRIGAPTMNTNLSYSEYNGLLSYLTDGALTFCRVSGGEPEIWPLEGEDVSFAPGGNSFCILYGGRLFIVQRETMKSRAVELRRCAVKVLSVYRDLAGSPQDWENSFSRDYIARKIALYERLSGN